MIIEKQAKANKENGKKGGRPKGALALVKISENNAIEELKQNILKRLNRIADAQMDNAEGYSVLYAPEYEKDKDGELVQTGKLKRVTDPAKIKELLEDEDGENRYYQIYTKDPNVKAADMLMNRVFGKPRDGSTDDQTNMFKQAFILMFGKILNQPDFKPKHEKIIEATNIITEPKPTGDAVLERLGRAVGEPKMENKQSILDTD